MRNTLSWKSHCPCDTLTSVYSSSGHHSDGVCCVALEVSEGGLSCCWVTELLGGLTTSLRTVGQSGSVEAVGSWAWTIPLPRYSDTWHIHEPSSEISGSRRGWGGTMVYKLFTAVLQVQTTMQEFSKNASLHTHTSCWYRNYSGCTHATSFITATFNIDPDGVLCVALEVGEDGTGCCCCVAHCVHHPRASLRLVPKFNKVNTHGHTLSWPLPWHSDTCVVCSSFRWHSNWVWYICAIELPRSNCYNWISCTQFYYLQQTPALVCYSVWDDYPLRVL